MLTIRQEISPNGKSGVFYHGGKKLELSFCHCEEGTHMTDAAIHRVSADAGGFVCSFIASQWIATGYALAMTRVVKVRCVCHCEEGAERGTRQSIVS
jgi:hypothetical protein